MRFLLGKLYGILEKEVKMTDYYKILGVDKSSSQEEIKKAYRKLALEYHPDKPTGDEVRFKEISEAYETLGDPQKRQQYELGGNAGFNPFGSGPDPFQNFENMFSNMFNSQRTRQHSHIPLNIDLAVEITIKELYCGSQKTLNFVRQTSCNSCNGLGASSKPCTACNGSGFMVQKSGFMVVRSACNKCYGAGLVVDNTKTCSPCNGKGAFQENVAHSVDLPPGAGHLRQTMTLMIPGAGNKVNGSTGSIKLYINIAPDARYDQDGLNLIYNCPISFADLCLGNKISVPLPDDNTISLSVARGTDLAKPQRIKNKGFRQIHTNQSGDLIIKFELLVPKELTSKQEEILNNLRQEGL
jgi:molecular chaperone DnaJ